MATPQVQGISGSSSWYSSPSSGGGTITTGQEAKVVDETPIGYGVLVKSPTGEWVRVDKTPTLSQAEAEKMASTISGVSPGGTITTGQEAKVVDETPIGYGVLVKSPTGEWVRVDKTPTLSQAEAEKMASTISGVSPIGTTSVLSGGTGVLPTGESVYSAGGRYYASPDDYMAYMQLTYAQTQAEPPLYYTKGGEPVFGSRKAQEFSFSQSEVGQAALAKRESNIIRAPIDYSQETRTEQGRQADIQWLSLATGLPADAISESILANVSASSKYSYQGRLRRAEEKVQLAQNLGNVGYTENISFIPNAPITPLKSEFVPYVGIQIGEPQKPESQVVYSLEGATDTGGLLKAERIDYERTLEGYKETKTPLITSFSPDVKQAVVKNIQTDYITKFGWAPQVEISEEGRVSISKVPDNVMNSYVLLKATKSPFTSAFKNIEAFSPVKIQTKGLEKATGLMAPREGVYLEVQERTVAQATEERIARDIGFAGTIGGYFGKEKEATKAGTVISAFQYPEQMLPKTGEKTVAEIEGYSYTSTKENLEFLREYYTSKEPDFFKSLGINLAVDVVGFGSAVGGYAKYGTEIVTGGSTYRQSPTEVKRQLVASGIDAFGYALPVVAAGAGARLAESALAKGATLLPKVPIIGGLAAGVGSKISTTYIAPTFRVLSKIPGAKIASEGFVGKSAISAGAGGYTLLQTGDVTEAAKSAGLTFGIMTVGDIGLVAGAKTFRAVTPKIAEVARIYELPRSAKVIEGVNPFEVTKTYDKTKFKSLYEKDPVAFEKARAQAVREADIELNAGRSAKFNAMLERSPQTYVTPFSYYDAEVKAFGITGKVRGKKFDISSIKYTPIPLADVRSVGYYRLQPTAPLANIPSLKYYKTGAQKPTTPIEFPFRKEVDIYGGKIKGKAIDIGGGISDVYFKFETDEFAALIQRISKGARTELTERELFQKQQRLSEGEKAIKRIKTLPPEELKWYEPSKPARTELSPFEEYQKSQRIKSGEKIIKGIREKALNKPLPEIEFEKSGVLKEQYTRKQKASAQASAEQLAKQFEYNRPSQGLKARMQKETLKDQLESLWSGEANLEERIAARYPKVKQPVPRARPIESVRMPEPRKAKLFYTQAPAEEFGYEFLQYPPGTTPAPSFSYQQQTTPSFYTRQAPREIPRVSVSPYERLGLGNIQSLRMGELQKMKLGEIEKMRLGEVQSLKMGELQKMKLGEIEKMKMGQVEKLKLATIPKLKLGTINKLKIVEPVRIRMPIPSFGGGLLKGMPKPPKQKAQKPRTPSYSPSVTAAVYGITGKVPKGAGKRIYTGFEFRPLRKTKDVRKRYK